MELTFRRAKLAPSKMRAAGIDTDPIKAAVSVMNASGGLLSGAKGTRLPLHPSTGTKSALRGEMMPQGMAMTMESETGVANPLTKIMTFLVHGTFSIDGTGVMG